MTPNHWCKNLLTVVGDRRIVEKFDREFKGRPALCLFEGQEVKGKALEKGRAKKVADWLKEPLSYKLNALCPVPEDFRGCPAFIQIWASDNWGTLEDIEDTKAIIEEGMNKYYFHTLTSPTQWLKRVAKDWPKLTFELVFFGGDNPFAGEERYVKGKIAKVFFIETDEISGFVAEKFRDSPI